MQQLLLQDLTSLAALSHGVYVYLCEGVVLRAIAVLRETPRLVRKDQIEEVVLNVFAPQRYAIFLLEVSYLVSRVY